MKRLIIICISSGMIISCTTQKAIKETGKEIDNGNYGVAAYYVAMLPVAMIVDVITLGGTSDPATGISTISTIANKSSGSSGISTSLNNSSLKSTNANSDSYPARVTGQSNGSSVTTSSTRTSTVSSVNHCLAISRRDKWSMKVNNSCSFLLDFKYCFVGIEDGSWPSCGSSERAASLSAGANIFLSAPPNSLEVRSVACKSYKGVHSIANIRWNGNSLSGDCLAN